MPNEYGPTARHRRLAAELRHRRETVGLTPEQAASTLGWHRTKLVRIETAVNMPSVADVERILDTYGGGDAVKATLLQLAREIRTRGWWTSYGDAISGSYGELEDAADRIRSWQTEVVPGLLQHENYARTLIEGENSDQAEVDRRLSARMKRRALLSLINAPSLDVVLAEEVLRRPVGGPAVMAQQLRALLEDAARPNVSVRVVPISIGYRPNLGLGSLTLFEFDAAIELDTAHVDAMSGETYVEDITQVRRCTFELDRISGAALSADDSAALIAEIAKEFQSHDA
ncbi:helix-turn-helix domain-containing protein [Actinomadura rayongensis]|uniref:Helix-turn-helix domain-containing protein n=1 Tax=Actinomadura rayongensis TaxID=1429076 RepID=A0A6I4WFF4_9ACTN|nr:helix-turn-helix transcriptional regulator [Actinomadura rayongensis]MXQ67025.1 helix-turn-helix domain-containing protein [Actinomadura rayongensis]